MKIFINLILIVLFLTSAGIVIFYPAADVDAAIKTPLERLQSFGNRSGFNTGETDPQGAFNRLLGQVIAVLLSFLGVIFLVLIIYSGFTWMTAGGDEAKVTKAKQTIQRAIIGLIIIAGSYAIWLFVITPIL